MLPSVISPINREIPIHYFPPVFDTSAELEDDSVSKESLFTDPLGELPLFLVVSESYPLSSDLVLLNFL